MKLDFIGEISSVAKGIALLQDNVGFIWDKNGRKIVLKRVSKGFCVNVDKETASIEYNTPVDFYRGLTLAIDVIRRGDCIKITQTPAFETLGVMLDVSRGAVMKTETVKDFILHMARMGFNELMLYTEDIYELKEYPYFGYMRGRYSNEELSDIVSYAENFGIETIPCIQTLGHLGAPLRWAAFGEMKDQNEVLLIGEDNTYKFIEEMIQTARRVFHTSKIHIGMDEAHGVGLGTYLLKNGFCDSFSILSEHLQRVLALCKKYDFEPMMWSDMFFRLGTPDGGYYSAEAYLPENIASLIPDGVSQVYWDYYNNNEHFYNSMLREHKRMECPVVFAGGVWTWSGPSINNRQTFESTLPALKLCKEHGVKHVIATMWGDDGAECDCYEALYGLQLFAECSYNSENPTEHIDEMFYVCNGYSAELFKLFDLDNFDIPTFCPDNPDFAELESHIINTSKQVLYQNPLIGLFDKNFAQTDLHSHYSEILKKLEKMSIPEELSSLISVHRQLLRVLKSKCDIGIRVKEFYDNSDKEGLKNISTELRNLSEEILEYMQLRKKLWYEKNKPFGFENIILRLSAVHQLTVTAYERIESFLNGEIENIEELETERLWYNGIERPHFMEYFSHRIIAPHLMLG